MKSVEENVKEKLVHMYTL